MNYLIILVDIGGSDYQSASRTLSMMRGVKRVQRETKMRLN